METALKRFQDYILGGKRGWREWSAHCASLKKPKRNQMWRFYVRKSGYKHTKQEAFSEGPKVDFFKQFKVLLYNYLNFLTACATIKIFAMPKATL